MAFQNKEENKVLENMEYHITQDIVYQFVWCLQICKYQSCWTIKRYRQVGCIQIQTGGLYKNTDKWAVYRYRPVGLIQIQTGGLYKYRQGGLYTDTDR